MIRTPIRAAATMAASALCLALMGAAWSSQDDGFKPLFNGKDLAGWEGDPSNWKVEDGVVVGTTTAAAPLPYNQFLIWKGGTVKDFHLKAKVRQKGNNSGIQYRSQLNKGDKKFSVVGYQCDIHPAPNYNGMLYDEGGRGIAAENGQRVTFAADGKKEVTKAEPAPADPDGWNEYEIIAEGPKITHKINGKVSMELVDLDEKQRELEGILALQIHAGPPMKVEIKDVMLKPLAPAAATAQEKAEAPKAQGFSATPADGLKVAKGFKAELLYSVPKETQGSWVNLCLDDKGRIIASDQYGKLYRVTPPATGAPASDIQVQEIPVALGSAQGLLWAFDSLYVVVNAGKEPQSGLYRVTDSDGDGELDKVTMLRKFDGGGGEHGPHAVLLTPDGKNLNVVCGNQTKFTEIDTSRVPLIWGEDHLLPRMPDGRGFMVGVLAPGGCIYQVDPEGKTWELIANGFRNQYDAAYNRDGELFTYDADMEWDVNTPWYRPTRVNHVLSGAEFGWRNGAGKWPAYYPDSVGAVVNIGPGSPTGVTFGYGAKFPAKYQDAFFISDWSYGKLYATHLTPDGASYKGELEEFVTGTPLPLTDVIVRPQDGAMYFAVGGRKTQSGLYRVTYTGSESTAPSAKQEDAGTTARATRRTLEAFHGKKDPQAVALAWPYLGAPDRALRYAARVAIEWQDPATWGEKALAETNPATAIPALLALTRVSAVDPSHRKPETPAVDETLRDKIHDSLGRIDFQALPYQGKLDLIRTYTVLLNRMGRPGDDCAEKLIAKFDALYPTRGIEANVDIANILVFLQAPTAARKTVELLEKAPTQEEQIDLARALRVLKAGWTPDLRQRYFSWFLKAGTFKGGNSFDGFMNNIKNDAMATLSDDERVALKDILEAKLVANTNATAAETVSRPFVKAWSVDDFTVPVDQGLKGGRDYDRGRAMFAAAQCYACHRFGNEGGAVGPDLTGAVGRFSPRDLMESIVLPSKSVSDQYEAVSIATEDGKVITGRIVNLNGDNLVVMPNMLQPNTLVNVPRRKIEEMRPSPVSMMPEGLLNTLSEEEILDLAAYILSRGDRDSAMFKVAPKGGE